MGMANVLMYSLRVKKRTIVVSPSNNVHLSLSQAGLLVDRLLDLQENASLPVIELHDLVVVSACRGESLHVPGFYRFD